MQEQGGQHPDADRDQRQARRHERGGVGAGPGQGAADGRGGGGRGRHGGDRGARGGGGRGRHGGDRGARGGGGRGGGGDRGGHGGRGRGGARRGGARRGRAPRGGGGRRRALLDPEHLVLHIGALGALGVHGEAHVPALLGVRGDVGQGVGEVIGAAGVEVGAAPGRVLADVEGVGEQLVVLALVGRGPGLEGHGGREIARVIAVEVDLDHAADVGLVVGVAVEGRVVDLDGAVVARGVLGGGGASPHHHGSGTRQHGGECH